MQANHQHFDFMTMNKPNKTWPSQPTELYKPLVEENSALMMEILEYLPNLKSKCELYESTAGSLKSSSGCVRSSLSPESEDGDSLESDSGIESSIVRKSNASRWIHLDLSLLHEDTKSFLKKSFSSLKKPKEIVYRKTLRSSSIGLFFSPHLSDDDPDKSIDRQLLKMLPNSNENIESEFQESIIVLCGSIGKFMIQRQFIEQEIFELTGSFLRYHTDMTSLMYYEHSTSLFEVKMQLLLDVLFNDMNIFGVEMLISQMESHCRDQNMPNDNDDAHPEDMRQSIEWFRYHLIDYIKCATDENLMHLDKIARHLSMVIDSITTRLWILCTLVEA